MIDLKTGTIYSDNGLLLGYRGMNRKDLEILQSSFPHLSPNKYIKNLITIDDVKFLNMKCYVGYTIDNDFITEIRLHLLEHFYKNITSFYDISEEMLKNLHEIDCKIVNDITGNPTESVYNWGLIKPIYNTRSWDSYILIRYN